LNDDVLAFFAGVPGAQDLYAYHLLTGGLLRVTHAGDIRTRGQFWSRNRQWWYFVRSDDAGTVNNLVGVHASTVALRDITGSEFSHGGAPALRTGALDTTTDPWFAREMQLRFADDGWAYFTARRTTDAANVWEDANVFRFDVERGGEAQMLTAFTGRGPAHDVVHMDSLTISRDGKLLAWAQRHGTGPTAHEEVFMIPAAGGPASKMSRASGNRQEITDGSICFTRSPASGLVWSAGSGAVSVPASLTRIEWVPLGGPSIPLVLAPPPGPATGYQVLGARN